MGSTRYIMSIGELTRKDNSLCLGNGGEVTGESLMI